MERQAVIFDLDGTLIDSEPNYLKADRELVRRYGGEMSEEEHHGYVGIGSWTFLKIIKEKWNLSAGLQEMLELKDQLYMELARANTAVFPEMARLLEKLRGRKVPMAVASGSSREVIRELTEATGIRHYFDVLVSAGEVDRGKPAPDVFLETARRLGVPARDCTVVEDSRYGVQAALAAGMACAAVPGPSADGALHQDYHRAHRLFRGGMGDFSAEAFLQWLDGEGAAAGDGGESARERA